MEDSMQIKWGIMGGARVNERLLPAIIEAKNSKLLAIGSRRQNAAKETLAQYAPAEQDVRSYDGLLPLLEDSDIEAIYLPLANEEHYLWALKALNAGKHVLCEKPMALQVEHIIDMQAAARANGVKLMEGFMYRLHPQHQRIAEIIHSGLIGDIISSRSCFSFLLKPARKYRISRDINHGGGALWDIGCYAIHAARLWMNGDPKEVMALANISESGADLACSGVLDYGNGYYAQFDFSFLRARRSEYELIGTKGGIKCHTVWQNPGDIPVISWWTESGQNATEQLDPANHFVLEIEHFADCIIHNTSPLLTERDTLVNCASLEATIRSIQQKKSIIINA